MSTKLTGLEDKKIKPSLRLIVWGINCGHLQGEEAELRQFILLYLTDPAEIGIVNQAHEYSTTPIGALFNNFSERTQEVKVNIIRTFRIFFEQAPCSIMKSVLVKNCEDEEGITWTESAIERIGNFNLQEELEPELLLFIREYASQLDEIELRKLVYGIHNNPKLIKQLTVSLGQFDLSCLERNGMLADKLKHSILRHWHPDHRGDLEFFYHDFPAIEMWRLFMDGDQQKNGWQYYEAREKGCINQLYQGWVHVSQTMSERLTPDYFKTIHAICAKGIIWNWEKSAGVYREYAASFGVSTNSMSCLGYLEHMQTLNDICSLKRHRRLGFDAKSIISTDKLDLTIESFIKEYESALLVNTEEPQAILRSIIIFCKKLVLIHPFSDCNGRLFCNLILNRELIRNGFSPTLLDDPNRIDGYTVNESIFELIRGMDSFQYLKTAGLFKDTMKTSELIETESYPIPDIWKLFEQSKSKTAGPVGFLGQYGIFTVPKENSTALETQKKTIEPQ